MKKNDKSYILALLFLVFGILLSVQFRSVLNSKKNKPSIAYQIENLKLASSVLEEYGIEPENISVVQSANIKTVWRIKTKDRELCLKRLKHPLDKALFSVNAQDFIYNHGGNVAGIIRDKEGNLIHSFNDQLFVVYEWLYGRDLSFVMLMT